MTTASAAIPLGAFDYAQAGHAYQEEGVRLGIQAIAGSN